MYKEGLREGPFFLFNDLIFVMLCDFVSLTNERQVHGKKSTFPGGLRILFLYLS